jgi:hypothetical protein
MSRLLPAEVRQGDGEEIPPEQREARAKKRNEWEREEDEDGTTAASVLPRGIYSHLLWTVGLQVADVGRDLRINCA